MKIKLIASYCKQYEVVTNSSHNIYQSVLEGRLSQKSSTYCLLLLIEILSTRFCGGVDFLKPINGCIVSNKNADGKSIGQPIGAPRPQPHYLKISLSFLRFTDSRLTFRCAR